MKCSICGEQGHNARTCLYKDRGAPRNHALWMKFDNITERETADLQAAIIKDKSRIAPSARGTSAKGNVHELPERIRESLKLSGGENDTEAE